MFVVLVEVLKLTNTTALQVIIFSPNLVSKSKTHLLERATISCTHARPFLGTGHYAKVVTYTISPPTTLPWMDMLLLRF